MARKWWAIVFAATLIGPTLGHAENLVKEVKKAVERSTSIKRGRSPFT